MLIAADVTESAYIDSMQLSSGPVPIIHNSLTDTVLEYYYTVVLVPVYTNQATFEFPAYTVYTVQYIHIVGPTVYISDYAEFIGTILIVHNILYYTLQCLIVLITAKPVSWNTSPCGC